MEEGETEEGEYAVFAAGPSRKVNQKLMERKEEKDQDPASARGQKEKVMQHGKMTSKTQLSGEKAKEKAKRARKE